MCRKPNTSARCGLLHTGTFQFAYSPMFPIDMGLMQVICETVLVLLQLLHAYRHARKLEAVLRPITPLLLTLYVDGFAYFVLVASLRLWSATTVRQHFLVLPLTTSVTPSLNDNGQLTDVPLTVHLCRLFLLVSPRVPRIQLDQYLRLSAGASPP